MITKLDNIFTTVEAARLAKVSETTIRLAVKNNILDAYQLQNSQYLIPEKHLSNYIKARSKHLAKQ